MDSLIGPQREQADPFYYGAAMYAQLTERARKVMQLANQEAQRLRHEYIGTEHILLGLVAEGTGLASKVLQGLGIDHGIVGREVEKIVQCGPYPVEEAQQRMTPRAKYVIEHAINEARKLKHHYVGTEHLLLGLVREIEGVAAQVLMNLGLTLKGVRHEVLCIHRWAKAKSSVTTTVTDLRKEMLSMLASSQYWEGRGRTVDVKKLSEDSKIEIQHLSEPVQKIVEELGSQIDIIEDEKKKAVAAQDFEKAAVLRDLADKLKKLRADFVRQWPKEP
jgi:hypothetical protein